MVNMAQRIAVRTVQRRLYASAASKPSVSASSQATVQTGQASNGIRLAAQQSDSPLARVVCAVKAGPRYEDVHQRGVSHCLRVTSDLTQREARAFGLTRHLQQMGANVSCAATREHLLYTLEVNKKLLPAAMPFLAGMVTQQSFRPWEISDSMPRLEYELLGLSEQPEKRLVEKAHEVAYRETGLGRSLYAPFFMMNEFSPDLLREFVNKNFSPQRLSLSAVGVGLEELSEYAAEFASPDQAGGASADTAAKFYGGGESREQTEEPYAYTVLMGDGASMKSDDVWAFAILEQLLGSGPSVRWGSNTASSLLNKAISNNTDQPFQIQAFNMNYSDSGIFGISAITVPENSDTVLRLAAEQIKSVSAKLPSNEALQAAKNRVKSTVAFQAECSEETVQGMAVDLLNTGECSDVSTSLKAIDSVQASQVQKAAKKLLDGKMTMVSLGEVYNVPYLDQL